MEIIEYIRKSGRRPNRDDNGNIVTKGCGIGRRKKGVMYATLNTDNRVIVGFSLCNNIDEFDHVNGTYEPGFGLSLAYERAEKWVNHTGYFLQKTWSEDELEERFEEGELFFLKNTQPKKLVEVPPSIHKALFKFLTRCKKYYNDKEFPAWAEALLNGTPEHVDGPTTRVYY